MPVQGLITRPEHPKQLPFKNPVTPSFLAPSIGYVKTPVIPLSTPVPIAFAPKPSPSSKCFGLFIFILSFSAINSSSNVNYYKVVDNDPVILLIELKVAAIVFLTNDAVPSKTPFPTSNGPLTNPSTGFSYKSTKPFPIVLINPTGFPIISKLPAIFKSYYIPYT